MFNNINNFNNKRMNLREDERIRILKYIFNKVFESRNDPRYNTIERYLDIGCGDCNITYKIGKFLKSDEIYGADILPLPDIPSGIKYLQIINNIIDLPDNSVDFVSCFVCIHHFNNIELMFKEICRVLKPGGYLYIRDHDIKYLKDYVLVMLLHILYGAKQKTYYKGTYFSLNDLRSYLGQLNFYEICLNYYTAPNPQKLYHILFQYDPNIECLTSDTDTNDQYISTLKLFKPTQDSIYWLHNEFIDTSVHNSIKDIIVKRMQKIFNISYHKALEYLLLSNSELNLYQNLYNVC